MGVARPCILAVVSKLTTGVAGLNAPSWHKASANCGSYEAYLEELRDSGETQKSLTDPDSRLMMANGKLLSTEGFARKGKGDL